MGSAANLLDLACPNQCFGSCSRTRTSNIVDMSEKVGKRDILYLFACHVEWRIRSSMGAYQELLAALDDPHCEIRSVEEVLLRRNALRPQPSETTVDAL